MLRLTKISCIAFGGWVAGLATERFLQTKSKENPLNLEPNTDNIGISFKPGLPIFGTVSAATLIPKPPQDVQPIPPEPSLKSPRVSQVLYALLLSNFLTRFIFDYFIIL